MKDKRNTYKYHFLMGNKIVHTGVTNDLERRENEHRQQSGQQKGHIRQVGYVVNRKAAAEWEQQQQDAGKPVRKK